MERSALFGTIVAVISSNPSVVELLILGQERPHPAHMNVCLSERTQKKIKFSSAPPVLRESDQPERWDDESVFNISPIFQPPPNILQLNTSAGVVQ